MEETPRYAKSFEVVWRTDETRRVDHIKFEFTEDAADYGRKAIGHFPNERFLIVALDHEKRYIGESQINAGNSVMSIVDLTGVLRAVIVSGANKIILFHNHPGCGPEPSRADIQLTVTLARVCAMLQIEVVEHIIIGEDDYYSFREEIEPVLRQNPDLLPGF